MECCATCRYWIAFEGVHNAPLPTGWNACERAYGQHGERPERPTRAYAVDQEEYQAYLATAPGFGCVQHEPKDTG